MRFFKRGQLRLPALPPIIPVIGQVTSGAHPELEVVEHPDGTVAINATLVPGAAGRDGKDGTNGINGTDGAAGRDGIDGRNGTDGATGTAGLSAYDLAREAGYGGTKTQWLASLKGEPGANGTNGAKGDPGGMPAYYADRIQANASGILNVTFPAGRFTAAPVVTVTAEAASGTPTFAQLTTAPTKDGCVIQTQKVTTTLGGALANILNALISGPAASAYVNVTAIQKNP